VRFEKDIGSKQEMMSQVTGSERSGQVLNAEIELHEKLKIVFEVSKHSRYPHRSRSCDENLIEPKKIPT